MYGLDLMGSWGGEEDWTVAGNQWGHDDNGQWDNGQLRSLQPVYSRSLAMIQPAPIAISDRYSAIAEPSPTVQVPSHVMDCSRSAIDVPLDNLIVANQGN